MRFSELSNGIKMSGRTMFNGVKDMLDLELKATRQFRNEKEFLSYEPSA